MRWVVLAGVLIPLFAGCGGSSSTTSQSTCVAGFNGFVITVRGSSPQQVCDKISHVGKLGGWTGQPSLPTGVTVGEACLGTDPAGDSATVQTTGADPTEPISLVTGVLAQSGYKIRMPLRWSSGC